MMPFKQILESAASSVARRNAYILAILDLDVKGLTEEIVFVDVFSLIR